MEIRQKLTIMLILAQAAIGSIVMGQFYSSNKKWGDGQSGDSQIGGSQSLQQDSSQSGGQSPPPRWRVPFDDYVSP